MDLYNIIAGWIGWPIVVASLLIGGSYIIYLLKTRLDYQKEINSELIRKLENQQKAIQLPGKQIKYRSFIKLIHYSTGFSLHSEVNNYEHPGSSRQQQVTAYPAANDNDYWIVKGAHAYPEFYKKGETVKSGEIIRLEHVNTRTNLHSHGFFPAPVSGDQQEITSFGRDGIGDVNDNWRVDLEDRELWEEGKRVRLIHEKTNVSLHSHDKSYSGQHEVTGFAGRDSNDWWIAVIVRDPESE